MKYKILIEKSWFVTSPDQIMYFGYELSKEGKIKKKTQYKAELIKYLDDIGITLV